jgi:hypothetical protein
LPRRWRQCSCRSRRAAAASEGCDPGRRRSRGRPLSRPTSARKCKTAPASCPGPATQGLVCS